MSHSAANLTSSHVDDPLDEPPPYTPRADTLQGESTVEYGPTRPFQRVSGARPVPELAQQQQPRLLSSPSAGVSRRGRSLWQQLTDQIDEFANELERRGTRGNPQRTGVPWSSYPGRPSTHTSTLPLRRNVPSPPPRRRVNSSSSLPETSSEFARDFYAAGTGEGLFSDTGTSSRAAPNMPQREDRSPSTTPMAGRPLLRDGKLLVYPRGHMCEKCLNTGYQHFDPDQPCKKCWNKYARPFCGPLAYSYSSSGTWSNTQNTHLQKPLPEDPAPGWAVGRGHRVNPSAGPGTVIYRAGDARIGGRLCWRCDGKGTMNMIIDVINCPICHGCGRTFGCT